MKTILFLLCALGNSYLVFAQTKEQNLALNINISNHKQLENGKNTFADADDFHSNVSIADARDGQSYTYKQYGDQFWITQNINFKVSGSNCYNDSDIYCKTYGRLYTWEEAKKACPTGYHLPSDDEWKILEQFLGLPIDLVDDRGFRGKLGVTLKKGGESEFNVLMAGYSSAGEYVSVETDTSFWTSTEYNETTAWIRGFAVIFPEVNRDKESKTSSYSVRCLKD